MAQVIVKAEGVGPLVRRSAKGSADIRIAALSVLRDVAKHGHSLVDSGIPGDPSLGFTTLCVLGLIVQTESRKSQQWRTGLLSDMDEESGCPGQMRRKSVRTSSHGFM